jgi:hypothetical protein
MHNPLITLEKLAEKTGVSPQRVTAIRKIYEDNRHDPTLLLTQLKSKSLSVNEVAAIMAYVGAVIAGKAKDDHLYQSNFPD